MKFGPSRKSSGKATKASVTKKLREAMALPKQTPKGKQAERDALSKLNAGMPDAADADADVCLSEAKKASGAK